MLEDVLLVGDLLLQVFELLGLLRDELMHLLKVLFILAHLLLDGGFGAKILGLLEFGAFGHEDANAVEQDASDFIVLSLANVNAVVLMCLNDGVLGEEVG